jgi:hypothetical protein
MQCDDDTETCAIIDNGTECLVSQKGIFSRINSTTFFIIAGIILVLCILKAVAKDFKSSNNSGGTRYERTPIVTEIP